MNQTNSSKQIMLSVVGVAILVVAVVGISFAFFNYTRTGGNNTITTGQISFNSTNSLINVQNVFPIAKSAVATDSANSGTGTVTITGNTNYTNGIDFTVRATNVSSSIGTTAGKIPLSLQVTSSNLTGVTAFGSNSGSMTLNSFEDGTTIAENSVIASGRIPANTNINGTITIKAYVDASQIAITDTVENGDIQVSGYTNGTTSTWIDGRTVMTTAQWNALNSTGASFKITVEANEGAAA